MANTKDSVTSPLAAYSRWYNPDLDLSPSTRHLLETYSHISIDEVDSHLHAVRDKAWAIHPYPCVGSWRFLNLAIGNHSLYRSEVLPRMLTGDQTFLDLGCAFAQDVRRLVADGVDSSCCYGADLRLSFIDLGYELFRDKSTLRSKFIEADIFAAESGLDELKGKVDIINASSFFHLFSWEQQKSVARAVIKLLKPHKGSLLLGRHVGEQIGRERARGDGGTMWRHDVASWQRMWKEVGEESGTTFEVLGSLAEIPGMVIEEPNSNARGLMMSFSVRRLD